MDFREALKKASLNDIYVIRNGKINDDAVLKAFLEYCDNNKNDKKLTWQYSELKSILATVPNFGTGLLEACNTDINNGDCYFSSLEEKITEYSRILDSNGIGYTSYAYYISCYITLLVTITGNDGLSKLGVEATPWLSPEDQDYRYDYSKLDYIKEKTFGVGAENTPVAELFTLEDDGSGGTVLIEYLGKASCIVIPNNVKTIKRNAFGSKKDIIESVYIPDSVTDIEAETFKECGRLQTVILGKNITSLSNGVFEKCGELVRIALNGVTEIGNACFRGCTNLTDIGNCSFNKIGTDAFNGCKNLNGIEDFIINAVSIGDTAFQGCKLSKLVLEKCESVGDYAFRNCEELNSIFISSQLTQSGKAPFKGCYNVTELEVDNVNFTEQTYLLFSDESTDSGDWARNLGSVKRYNLNEKEFAGYTSLKDVLIKGCSQIPNGAFFGCIGLKNVEFTEDVTSIGDSAFENCQSINSFNVNFVGPKVGAKAFSKCNGIPLAEIFAKAEYIGEQAFADGDLSKADFNNKKNFSHIGADAFVGARLPEKFSLDLSGCKYVSKYALSGITEKNELLTFTVDSVSGDEYDRIHQMFSSDEDEFNKHISINTLCVNGFAAEHAFSGYNNIRAVQITIDESRVPRRLFSDCRKLRSVKLLGEVKYIDPEAFKGCASLSELDMKYSSLELGYRAFMGCHNIQNILNIALVTRFGNNCFKDTDIKSLVLGDNVEYIGAGAFANCNDIEEVVIPFVGCSPDSKGKELDSFGAIFGQDSNEGACPQTVELGNKTVTYYIPAGVRSVTVNSAELKPDCFAGIASLEEIHLPKIADFTVNAFSLCTGLRCLYLGASLTNFSVEALGGEFNTIGIHVDSGCETFVSSVAGSVLSRDQQTLYYLYSGDDLNEFIPGLTRFCTGSVWKSPESLVIGDGVEVMSRAIKCDELRSIKINSGCKIEPSAFTDCDGIKSIELNGCCPRGIFELNEQTANISEFTVSGCSDEATVTGVFAGEKNKLNIEKLSISAVNFGSDGGDLFKDILSVNTLNIGAGCIIPENSISGTVINELYVQGYNGVISNLFRKICAVDTVVVKDTNVSDGEFKQLRIGTLVLENIGTVGSGAFADTKIGKLVLKNVGNIAHDVFVHADIDQLESQTDKYTMVNGILYCDGVLIRCFDKNISGFTVPKHVTRVCTAAFENMSKLTQVEVAHSSVTFEKGVFTNCKNLRKFELTDIENNCFDELFDDAASITFLVYNGKSIKRKFFSHLANLREVRLNNTDNIGELAFVGDVSLEMVYGLSCVKHFGDMAFSKCEKLVAAELSPSCTRVGLGAFEGCISLQKVSYPIDAYQVKYNLTAVDIFGENRSPKLVVEITGGDIPAGYFKNFDSGIRINHMPENIGDEAFRNSALRWIQLNFTAVIGAYAFSGTGLTDIYLHNVKTVGEGAFENCYKLKNVELNDRIEYLGADWLKGVPLERLCGASGGKTYKTVNDCLISYVSQAAENTPDPFSDEKVWADSEKCGELVYVSPNSVSNILVIDSSVRSISADAFKGSNVNWLDASGVENIAENAFATCKEIRSIKLNSLEADGASVPLSYFVGNNREIEYVELSNGEKIVDRCFAGFRNLEKVVLPAEVKSIGDKCFAGCHKLREIHNLVSLTHIGELVFDGCESITSLSLPYLGSDATNAAGISYLYSSKDDVALRSLSIGCGEIVPGAFEGCKSLVEVTLPSGINIIPRACFKNCVSLKRVDKLDNIINVEDEAFYNCESLENVKLPVAESVGNKAFGNCKKLSSFILSENIKYIGNYILYECRQLKKLTIAFTPGVDTANKLDVGGCDSIKELNILGNVIGAGAFKDCETLEKVNISDSITEIPESAFHNCSSLKTVRAHSTVRAVGDDAFSDCNVLETVNFIASLETIGRYAFAHTKISGNYRLKDLTRLEEGAFCGTPITGIELGDGLKAVGKDAFKDCSALESVVLGKLVTTVNERAFGECKSLKNIDLSKIEVFGKFAFKNCVGLTQVDLACATHIFESCFEGCAAITGVNLGSGLVSIDKRVFFGCIQLTDLNIPEKLQSIGDRAFAGTAMKSKDLFFPETLTEVGEYIFEDADSPNVYVKNGQPKECKWNKKWGHKCKRHGFLSTSVTVKDYVKRA